MRALLPVAVAMLVAACGGSVPSTGQPNASSVPGGPAPSVDANARDTLVAQGLPLEDATFLAATTYAVSSVDGKTEHVVEHLASGDTIEFTVKVAASSSDGPRAVTATSTTTDTETDVYLTYSVEADNLPSDVRDALTAAAARQVVAAGEPPLALTADISFFEVTIDWALKKVESTLRDKGIKAVLSSLTPGNAGPIMGLIKAGFTIEKSAKIGAEVDELLAKLAELEDCAKDPTNPLTIKQYQQDPGAKQRVLDQIEAARFELVANTIVMELGVLNGFLAGMGPTWLGYVIGPGTAWSKATLEQLNKDRLAEIERAVPKCDCPYLSSGGATTGGTSGGGTSGGTSGGGTSGGVCKFPFTWNGTASYEITRNGVVVFSVHATQVTWKLRDDNPSSISEYDLVSATIAWTYDQVEECVEWHGSGHESGVPDEERDFGSGEGGAGGDVDEVASLTIQWIQTVPSRPAQNYGAGAATRLHDKIHYTGCNGEASDHDPDMMDPSLTSWLIIPSDPVQVIVDERLHGTWTLAGFSSKTWTWDFTVGN